VAFILSQGIFGETIYLGWISVCHLEQRHLFHYARQPACGNLHVTARYAGDGNFASSLSAPVTVTVGQGSSTVTITRRPLIPVTCDTRRTSFAYGSIMMIRSQLRVLPEKASRPAQ